MWYINIHTQAFPGGEICGQVQIANDMGEDSSGPWAVDSLTSGSTTGAALDEPPSLDCGTSVTAPGVWYTVTGTGNTMTASTCVGGGSSNYDTKISVYCADCETNECIGGNDDDFATCGVDFTSTFSWPRQPGATYNVLVHGFAAQICAAEALDICVPDICIALPASNVPLAFPGRAHELLAEPISKE